MEAGGSGGFGSQGPTFRSATPNSRGQYSAAVLDELESQNDEQVGVLSSKVKELKNVSGLLLLFLFEGRRVLIGLVDTSHRCRNTRFVSLGR